MNDHQQPAGLSKTPTGIQGLDAITGGGLPRGRSTMVLGNAGCGKTLLGLEFLVRGALEFNEPGVFVAFEETPGELSENVRSLGWDLDVLVDEGRLALDYVHLDPATIIETGEYNLEGLFVRLSASIQAVGAKRLVLDTVEALFSSFRDATLLRAELRRLIQKLKEQGITSVFTGELGPDGETRYGIEDYVSDCVIRLDHRTEDQVSTRRLQVAKYRGSRHGTNEYPFTIGDQGFEILPITALGLDANALVEQISTGIAGLDALFGGQGPYRGSSVLISGTAGTGKTSIAAHIADAACRRGESVLFLSFEESPAQTLRNMGAIGLNLAQWRDRGLLTLSATRPSAMGLDAHLVHVFGLIRQAQPQLVVLDPITNLAPSNRGLDQKAVLAQLLDQLKTRGVTALLTDLTHPGTEQESTSSLISSLIDSWLVLRDLECGGERNRLMYLLKSRGMAHSNQLREYRISAQGIELDEPYLGPSGVVTGSARYSQEARELAEQEVRRRAIERNRDSLTRQRQIAEARIAVIRAELAEQEAMLEERIGAERDIASTLQSDRQAMQERRDTGTAEDAS